MILGLVIWLACRQPSSLTPQDRHNLAELHTVLLGNDAKIAAFERRIPRNGYRYWQSLQARLPKKSKNYLEVTYLLALCRVDYRLNVERLSAPCKLWNRYRAALGRNRPIAEDEQTRQYLEDAVYLADDAFIRLYLKYRDRTCLRYDLLLLVDDFLAEAHYSNPASLWRRHKEDMVWTAYGSQDCSGELVLVLAEYIEDPDPTDPKSKSQSIGARKQQVQRDLANLMKSKNPRTARAAGTVKTMFHKYRP